MQILNTTPFIFAPCVGRVNSPGHSLTLIVKGTFDLVPDQPAQAVEEQLYPTGDEFYPDDDESSSSIRYESDFAYFKPCTDLLLVGACYPPGGVPRSECRVAFRVGQHARTLTVYGDREWDRGWFRSTILPAQPFTRMELRYEQSFGGADYGENPVGKGYAAIEGTDGTRRCFLPNVEDPSALITSPRDQPFPAGFGPLGRMWKLRTGKLGSYRGKWMVQRWPWFPDDLDWTHFNAAPPPMQMPGYLKGDEAIYLENLHPERPQLRAFLPGVRVRVFLSETSTESVSDADPHFREVTMHCDTLWVDAEASQLVLVWRGVADVRSEEYNEVQHLFICSEATNTARQSLAACQQLFLDALAAEDAEWNPPEEAPEDDTTEDDGPSAEEVVSAAEAEMEAEIEKAIAEANKELAASGLDPITYPMDPNELPEPSAEAKAQEKEILEALGLGNIEEEIAQEIADLQAEVPQPLDRAALAERVQQGESLADADASELDLSGMDLAGADLQQAILEKANLQGTNLTGANLTGANLAGANLQGATLDQAVLQQADFTAAVLSGASLRGAVATDANFEQALLHNAALDDISANDAVFSGADLTEASCQRGQFPGAEFCKAVLTRVNFQHANLQDADVEEAIGEGVDMTAADISGLRASDGCQFVGGSFRLTTANESIWEQADLTDADFSYATLHKANFSKVNLTRAVLHAADAKFARFPGAVLQQARCTTMNLFEGSLEKADLTDTDFTGSNLYGVEFLDARIHRTRLDDANVKMTKMAMKDWRHFTKPGEDE